LVQWKGTSTCLGVLIAPDIVLTAGHCGHWDIDPFTDREVTFPAAPNVKRSIVARQIHPKFNFYVKDFDLQLLKLDKSALVVDDDDDETPTGLSTIELHRTNVVPTTLTELGILEKGPNFSTTATSFGGERSTTSGNWEDEPKLQQVSTYPVANEMGCSEWDKVMEEWMICTQVKEHGASPQARSCDIPGGAPVMGEDDNGNLVVIGIVSWGKSCSRPTHGGVSAKVRAGLRWIDETTCAWSTKPPDIIDCTRAKHQHVPYESNGPGHMTVTVQHDKFSREVAWVLTHLESTTQLYYQAYDSLEEEHVTVTQTFQRLPVGEYQLELGDQQMDGMYVLSSL
jgi:secreted trypsin-like serine protease